MLRLSSRRKATRAAALTAMGVFTGLTSVSRAASGTWINTGAGDGWNVGSNWAGGIIPGADNASLTPGNTDTATFNAATGVTVQLDQGNQSIGSIIFSNSITTSGYQLGNTSSGNVLILTAGGSILNSATSSGNQTFGAPVDITGAYTINDTASGNTLLFNNAVTDSSLLTITGSGATAGSSTVTFAGGLGGFTGTMNISTGAYDRVYIDGTAPIPTSATFNIGSTSSSASTLYSNRSFGSGVVFNLYGNGSSEGYGALRLDGGGSVAGPVTLETSSTIGSGSGVGTISGVISGVGSSGVTFEGAGTIVLSGTNTYTGSSTLSGVTNAITVTVTGNETAATGGWYLNPSSASGTYATTLNFNAGSSIVVASSSGVQVGVLSSSGDTSNQTLNVAGTVSNAGSLQSGRSGIINFNSGAVWSQTGSLVAFNAEGGYGGTITIASGAVFNYTGTSPIQITPGTSGSELLVVNGIFTTGQGFYDAEASDSGGISTLNISGGSLVASASIPVLISTAGTTFGVTLGSAGGTFNTAGYSMGISAPIIGTGALTKVGAGTLSLSGTDTFTGNTTISAGTIDLTGGLALQDSTLISSGITFDSVNTSHLFSIGGLSGGFNLPLTDTASNGVTLTIGGNSVAAAYTGNLSGGGSLTKVGTALQSLSGTNTYTGTTTISAGTLEFLNESSLYNDTTNSWTASNITVNSGATMELLVGGTGQFTGSDVGTLVTNLQSNGGLTGLQPGSTLALVGSLTVPGTLVIPSGATITETGTLSASGVTFNNSGGLNITATGTSSLGALTVNAGEATLTSTYNTSGNTAMAYSSYTRAPGGVANFVVSGGTSGTTNQITLAGANGFIDQGTFFNGSGYAWASSSGGYLRAIAYGTDAGSATSASTTSLSSTSYQQFTGNITAQAAATFTTLNDAGNYQMSLGSGVTLATNGILKTGGNAGTFNGGTGITTATSGAEMVIRTNLAADVLTIASPILSNGGSSLTKSGAGTLIVSGGSADTYTGVTTIDAGTLENLDAATSNSFASSSGIVVNNGGTLYQYRTNGSSGITETVENPTTTLNGGGTLVTGSSLGSVSFVFSNNFVINGNVTVYENSGNYQNAITSNGSLSGTGNINFTSANGTNITNGHTFTLNTANSTYSGNWNLYGGTTQSPTALVSGAAGSLGSGTVTLGGISTLGASVSSGLNSLAGVTLNTSTATLNGPIGWSSSTNVSINAGVFNVGAAGSSAGNVTIGSLNQSGGAVDLYSTATTLNPLNLSGNYNYTGGSIVVNFSANPTASSYTLVNYSGTLTADPTISTANFPGYTVSYGTGSNSSITLVETNSQSNLVWTGVTPSNWDVGVTANFTNSSSGSAQVFRNNDNVTFDDTASSFTPMVPSGVSVYPATMTFNNNANAYTLSGAGTIAGLGTLTMNGTNVLTITSTNSFTGGVFLNDGTVSVPLLAASGTNSPLGSAGTITFNGGTLAYTGTGSNTTNRAIAFTGAGTINVNSSTGNIVQSGVASGTGGLLKTGPGTLTMSGASTYTGGTVIQSGTAVASVSNSGTTSGAFGASTSSITLGNGNTGSSPILFNVSSGITVSNPIVVASQPTGIIAINAVGTSYDVISSAMTLNQTLTVNDLNTNYSSASYSGTYIGPSLVSLDVTGSMSGAGGLTFNGPSGYLVDFYSGTNIYSGPTVITGSGVVEIGNSVTSDANSQMNIGSGSTVLLDNLGSGKIGGLIGGGLFQSSNGTTSVLSLGSANDANDVFTGTITGALTLTKVGTGTQVFAGTNTYTGSTTITAGTLTGTGPSPFGAATNALTVSNTNTTTAGTAVVLNLSTTSPTTTGTLSGSISTPTSGINTAVINNGGQLLTVNATGSATFAGSINGSGGVTFNNASTWTLTGNNAFTGLFTINQGTINLSGNDSAMTGGFIVGAPTITNTKLNISGGAIVNVAAGNSIQIGPLASGANAYTQYLNVAGTLNNAGSLELGYVNSDAVLSGGVLNQSGPAVLQPYGNYSSVLSINSGGTLSYTASSPFQLNASTGAGQAQLNIAGLFSTGEGFQQSNPSTTGYGAYVILNGGIIALANSVPQLTIGSYAFNFQLSTNGGTLNTNGFTTAIGDVISSVNSSSGGLVITGPGGSVTLSAANTYTGGTTISSGTAIAGRSNSGTISGAFGPSTSVIDLGDANTGASSVTLQLNNGDTVSNPIVVSNMPTGAITINAVGTTTNESLSGAITLNQSITINNTNSTFPTSNFNGSALSYSSLYVTGSASGVGGITYTGGETTDVYSGTNSYFGPTVVTGNSLVTFGNSVSTDANSVLNISAGSMVVTANLTNAKFGGLVGAGNFQGATGTNVVSIGYLNDPTDNFSGSFGGPLTLTKVGTGALVLTGTNVYSGTTTIAAGSIVAGATNTLSPNASINVSGGTLDVSGYNNSIPALTVGAAGTLNLGIGNVLTVSGAATLAGTLNLVSGTVSSLPETLMTYTSETGTFATTIGVPTGDTLLYSASALEIVSTGPTGPSTLNWTNASGNNTWDIATSANWNTSTGATVTYSDASNAALGAGDLVAFTDNNGGAGNYSVTLNTTVNPTSTTFNNSAGTYTLSGSGGISGSGPLIKIGSSPLVLNTVNTYTGGTNISGGTVTLGVAGALPAGTNLIIGANSALLTSNLGNAVALTVGSLSIAGQLDLNNNALVVHSSTLTAVNALVQSGYNSGAWNGSTGIISSAAANQSSHLTALGVILNDNGSGSPLYGSGGKVASTFAGSSPLDGDVLVKYTYYGDTNLNGEVDASDYSRIDAAFLADQTSPGSMTGWYNGDFNYDGVINGSDYTLMDNAFNTQGAQIAAEIAPDAVATAEIAPSGVSAVPEPTTLGLLGVGAIGLLGRRRRRRV